MDRRNQLLVIDYPGRRAAGHVSDLELEESGFDCRYTMQDDMPDDLYAGPYAGHLIEASKVDASRVAAVIGYCMAGHLAQEALALLTAATGSAPPLIVLNGAPSTASEIEEECRTTFEVFGDTSMGAALDAVRAKGLFADDALRGAPQRTVDEIRGVLRHAAVQLLIEDVASTDDLEESAAPLVDHYIGWLTHLVAAHNNTAPRWNGETLHVISRDHPYREDWPGASATCTIVVECERDRLLDTPATREAILGFLSRA